MARAPEPLDSFRSADEVRKELDAKIDARTDGLRRELDTKIENRVSDGAFRWVVGLLITACIAAAVCFITQLWNISEKLTALNARVVGLESREQAKRPIR